MLWRYTHHSWPLLVLAILWGASSIALHSQLTQLLPGLSDTVKSSAVFDGGVMEEVGKSIFLFGLLIAGARHFSSVGSGIVIGWFVGMGFAFLENISYYTQFIQIGEYGGVAFRFASTAMGGHGFYTGLTGGLIAYFLARYGGRSLLWLWPLALLPAVTLHALTDGLLNVVFGNNVPMIDLVTVFFATLGSLILMVPVLVISVRRQKQYLKTSETILTSATDVPAEKASQISKPAHWFSAKPLDERLFAQLAGLLTIQQRYPQKHTAALQTEIVRLKSELRY